MFFRTEIFLKYIIGGVLPIIDISVAHAQTKCIILPIVTV